MVRKEAVMMEGMCGYFDRELIRYTEKEALELYKQNLQTEHREHIELLNKQISVL